MYVSVNRPTMYFSVVTGGYLAEAPSADAQVGKHAISASKFGLQKKAIDWRPGVMISPALVVVAGGATTR